MDVTTLPTEMLVSIFKYVAPKELNRIRKINLMIDEAAKYGKLARTLVNDIFIIRRSHEYEVRSYQLPNPEMNHDSQFGHFAYTWKTIVGFIDNFDKLLKKITIVNSIDLGANIPINASFLATMKENRYSFKNVRKFCSYINRVDLSKKDCKTFIMLLPRVDDLSIYMLTPSNDIHNVEVLGNRKWSSLTVNISNEPRKPVFSELDDEFLVEVVSNCDFFHLTAHGIMKTEFTVLGVVNMMMTILARGPFNKQLNLGKLQLGQNRRDQVEGLFLDLSGAYMVATPAEEYLGRRFATDKYHVHFGRMDTYFLHFEVCVEIRENEPEPHNE